MVKKVNILFILMFALAVMTACSGSCPSKEKVKTLLQPFMPGKFDIAEIRSLTQGPPLCEVEVKLDKQPPMVIYLDRKARYIVSGSIIEIATKKNITLERQQALKK